MEAIGKLLFGVGTFLMVIGLCLWLFTDKVGWLGNLPGDIKIDRPGFVFYMPITTMLLVSAALSGILWLVGKLSR